MSHLIFIWTKKCFFHYSTELLEKKNTTRSRHFRKVLIVKILFKKIHWKLVNTQKSPNCPHHHNHMCTIRVLGPRLHPATGECFATTNGPRSRSLLPWWRSPHWNIWICRLLFTPRLNPRPLELQDAPAVCTSRSVAMEAVVGVRDEPSESPSVFTPWLSSHCSGVSQLFCVHVQQGCVCWCCHWPPSLSCLYGLSLLCICLLSYKIHIGRSTRPQSWWASGFSRRRDSLFLWDFAPKKVCQTSETTTTTSQKLSKLASSSLVWSEHKNKMFFQRSRCGFITETFSSSSTRTHRHSPGRFPLTDGEMLHHFTS